MSQLPIAERMRRQRLYESVPEQSRQWLIYWTRFAETDVLRDTMLGLAKHIASGTATDYSQTAPVERLHIYAAELERRDGQAQWCAGQGSSDDPLAT